MQACQSWMGMLSAQHKAKLLLSLDNAKLVARLDPADWYTGLREQRYVISKACLNQQTAAEVHYHVVDDKDEPISFGSFGDAAEFLHRNLGVLRVLLRAAS